MTTVSADPRLVAQHEGRARMRGDLQRLHDVLARTPMAGRVWLFGGLLLGWARDGDIMLHDTDDADFGFLAPDAPRLEATFPALIDAGFAPHLRFPGLHGEATEYSFLRDGSKFEFFRIEVAGDRFSYCNYGHTAQGVPVKNHCSIPAQPLEEVRFLDRTWLKARDHDLELTALYGDWRTPDPGFDYLTSTTIETTEPWDASTFELWGQVYGC